MGFWVVLLMCVWVGGMRLFGVLSARSVKREKKSKMIPIRRLH